MSKELDGGRAAYAARAWSDAYERLSRADKAGALAADDLLLLATSAYLVGRMDTFLEQLERTHDAYVGQGDLLSATRCAVYIGINLAILGEPAHASGWFGRAHRLVERHGQECAEHGYLLLPSAMRQLDSGQYAEAEAHATRAVELGERFRDVELLALALHVQGLTLIKQAQIEQGLALLDEAMLHVTAGDVTPIISGVVYCGVIAGCEEAYDVRRAQEWTVALTRWCDQQDELVAFTGRCLSHRAGIMQLHGAWADALQEARRARERCEESMNDAAAGLALYQQGEVHRLQGDFAAAEAAYRDASRLGHEPQPGLALLRLAQGDDATAGAALRRALGETVDRLHRTRLLPADAEISLALGDVGAARRSADELSAIAGTFDAVMLRAVAAQVQGMVSLAESDPQTSLVSLRAARATWQDLDAPYESARTAVLIGLACRALDDEGTAAMELEGATTVFEQLGALPDLARVEALVGADTRETHGLTPRELDVLRLVAAGMTNRDIAGELTVSEHTVARHIQNIFTKLSVSSRSAATAFAFEHHLV